MSLAGQPIVGIVGFVVMLTAATIGVTALRHPAMLQQPMRETRHEGFGVVDGGQGRPKVAALPAHPPRQARPVRSWTGWKSAGATAATTAF